MFYSHTENMIRWKKSDLLLLLFIIYYCCKLHFVLSTGCFLLTGFYICEESAELVYFFLHRTSHQSFLTLSFKTYFSLFHPPFLSPSFPLFPFLPCFCPFFHFLLLSSLRSILTNFFSSSTFLSLFPHSCLHFFLSSFSPFLPSWLNESDWSIRDGSWRFLKSVVSLS